ncbi:hypothetical protein ACE102_44805 (plasmid) [Bradyrhizobium sp. vgs-9]|jgi:hypothetical protein|uniref:hypothetical protein n=1 Tax=Bradyrhizobium TaxID=374 RepID=UPI0033974F12
MDAFSCFACDGSKWDIAVLNGVDEMVMTVISEQWEASQRGVLSMWRIYDRPADWPDGYVARRYETDKDGTVRTKSNLAGGPEALAMLRHIFSEAGLVLKTRSPGDDPEIAEVWM